MPTTATLRNRRHARICHLWLLDGVGTAFTDDPILSSGDYTGHGHDIRLGLDTDGMSVEEALDIRSGKLDETSATFVLVDFDEILPALFRAEDPDEEPLEQSVYPSDNLAARTELHGRHVGTECIGAAGQRARFPCVGSFQVGQLHIGLDQELPHHRPAPVTTTPTVWCGRRCALYRCYVDTDGTRRPFAEAERIWWGTMTDQGSVDAHRWQLEVAGPQSWLQRELGILTQRDPVGAIGALDLDAKAGMDETRIGVSFFRTGVYGATLNEDYGSRDFVASITGLTPADIIAEISAEMATAAGTAGPDGTFSAADNRYVSIDSHAKIGIHVDEDNANEATSTMLVSLHAKVWAALGFDPKAQRAAEGSQFVAFAYYDHDGDGLPNAGTPHGSAPGSGYVVGRFTTASVTDANNGDNDGHPRYYSPLYTGGTSTLLAGLNDGEGQVVDLGDGLGSTIIYHRGQLSRPIASDPDSPNNPYTIPNAGVCNRQGLWLFFGRRRFANGAEVDEYQVARASWHAGSLQQQGLVVGSRIVITEWLEPRLFGYGRDKMITDWVGRSNAEREYRIEAVPILALDYRGAGAPELAHVVIERLLRTTGTSDGWDSYSQDPSADLDPGDNDSAGTPHRDAEFEDLGLSIPDEMVQNVLQFGMEGDALPSSLGEVKVAFGPGMAADELLAGLMRPWGWAWSLRDGAYGIFSPTRTPAPAAVDLVLDGATKLYQGDPGSISQDLRAFAPIDKFKVSYSWAAYLDKFAKEYTTDSKDKGRRYRAGGITETMTAHGMRNLAGWATKARDMGAWWNRRHFFVRGWPYMERRPVHVGEFVRITDPRGFDASGVYGLDEMIGVVVRVQTNLRPDAREPWANLDVLVYAGSSGIPRLHAFAARAFGIDTDANRIYVHDNWLSIPHPDWPGDASRFLEVAFPGLNTLGGEPEIIIVQWDGGAWRAPITGCVVRAAGADANGSYLDLTGDTSGYFHKMDTLVLLAPRGTQAAAWVLARYGVTCEPGGTFDGGTPGFKWEDA